jgi:hypothetical protein
MRFVKQFYMVNVAAELFTQMLNRRAAVIENSRLTDRAIPDGLAAYTVMVPFTTASHCSGYASLPFTRPSFEEQKRVSVSAIIERIFRFASPRLQDHTVAIWYMCS